MTDQQPGAADLLGPKTILETQEAGRAAALAGDPATACPWPAPADARETALRAMWVRGFAAGRTEIRQRQSPTDPPSSD